MPNNLLRFISKELQVTTDVEAHDGDIFIVLRCGETEVGRRRLGKATCCHSASPCIGPVPIAETYCRRFGLPAYIHVSLCFDEVLAAMDARGSN